MPTILDLLMALNQGDLPPIPAPAQPVPLAPAPTGNVPEFGGPSQVTEPPQAPLDTRLIQQMLALRGPAPTAPAPLGRGQRIANALIGFGAGVQGYGPQFLEQLQQPQREYQRQLQQYNNLGTELGARGLETAQRQQELKTRRAQEVSDQQLQAEFQRETRRLNLTDAREKALLEDALLSRRQRQHDERLAEEARRKEQADKEKQAKLHERELIDKEYYSPTMAKEIAEYTAGIRPELSAAAQKYQGARVAKLQLEAQKIQKQIARINGVGVGGAQKLADEFEDLKRQLYPLRASGDESGATSVMRKLQAVGSKLQGKGYEVGYGDNPYQKPPQTRTVEPGQAAPTAGQTFSRAQVNAYAAKNKRNPADVEAELKARGFNVQ